MKICEICGCNEEETHCMTVSKKWNMTLCGKHIQQLKRHNKIIDASKQERNRNELNEIRIYEDHAGIVLYNMQGKEIAEALIDLDDVEKCKEHKWFIEDENYYVTSAKNKYKSKLRLHRFILDAYNLKEEKEVDHKNINPLDNRKENLRFCTSQENSINRSKQKNNTSGVTGVVWNTKYNRWESKIYINKKKSHLGYFINKKDAIKVRKEAEIKYYGEFTPIRYNEG